MSLRICQTTSFLSLRRSSSSSNTGNAINRLSAMPMMFKWNFATQSISLNWSSAESSSALKEAVDILINPPIARDWKSIFVIVSEGNMYFPARSSVLNPQSSPQPSTKAHNIISILVGIFSSETGVICSGFKG